jgi:hypothetical protein
MSEYEGVINIGMQGRTNQKQEQQLSDSNTATV